MDRRALFFVAAAITCAALTPPAPQKLRWFPLVLAGIYLVLAAASYIDNRARNSAPPNEP